MTNEERAERAAAVVSNYGRHDAVRVDYTIEMDDADFTDLLTDLLHLCDLRGWDFDSYLVTAHMHHGCETDPDDFELGQLLAEKEREMKFVVAPDLHLWPILKLKYPQMMGDSFHAATQIFEYAYNHGLPLVLPGDVMDYGERGGVSACLKFLAPRLYARSDSGLLTLFICGSHDNPRHTGFVANPPWLDVVQGSDKRAVVHLDNTTWTADGLRFYGFDAKNRADLPDAIAGIPDDVDVLVLHQGLKELLGYEAGEVKAYDCCCDDLVGKARLVICGHVHVSRTWERDETTFLSPGSGVPKSISETAKKCYHVVEMSDKQHGPPKIESIEIAQARDFLILDALDAAGRKEVLQLVSEYQLDAEKPEELRMGFLRLRYTPDGDFHEKLLAAASGKLHLELVPMAEVPMSLNTAKFADVEEGQDDIERITAQHVNPDDEPALYSLAVEIQKDPRRRPDEILARAVKGILDG